MSLSNLEARNITESSIWSVEEIKDEIKNMEDKAFYSSVTIDEIIESIKNIQIKHIKNDKIKIKTKNWKKYKITKKELIKLIREIEPWIMKNQIVNKVKNLFQTFGHENLKYYLFADPNINVNFADTELYNYIIWVHEIKKEYLEILTEKALQYNWEISSLFDTNSEKRKSYENNERFLIIQEIFEKIKIRNETRTELGKSIESEKIFLSESKLNYVLNWIFEEQWIIELNKSIKIPDKEEEKSIWSIWRLLCELNLNTEDNSNTDKLERSDIKAFTDVFFSLWNEYQENIIQVFEKINQKDSSKYSDEEKLIWLYFAEYYLYCSYMYAKSNQEIERAKNDSNPDKKRVSTLESDVKEYYNFMILYQMIWNNIINEEEYNRKWVPDYLSNDPNHFILQFWWNAKEKLTIELEWVDEQFWIEYKNYFENTDYLSDEWIQNILGYEWWYVPHLNRHVCWLKDTVIMKSWWTFEQKKMIITNYLWIVEWYSEDEEQILKYKYHLMKTMMTDEFDKPSLFALQLWATHLKKEYQILIKKYEDWENIWKPDVFYGSQVVHTLYRRNTYIWDAIEQLNEIIAASDNKRSEGQFRKWFTRWLESDKIPFIGSINKLSRNQRIAKLYDNENRLDDCEKFYLHANILFDQASKTDFWSLFRIWQWVQWSLTFMWEMACMTPALSMFKLAAKSTSIWTRVLTKTIETWGRAFAATLINRPRTTLEIMEDISDKLWIVFIPWIDEKIYIINSIDWWEDVKQSIAKNLIKSSINYSIEMVWGTFLTRSTGFFKSQVDNFANNILQNNKQLLKEFLEYVINNSKTSAWTTRLQWVFNDIQSWSIWDALSKATYRDWLIPEYFEEFLQQRVDLWFDWKNILTIEVQEQLETIATCLLIQWGMKSLNYVWNSINERILQKITDPVYLFVWWKEIILPKEFINSLWYDNSTFSKEFENLSEEDIIKALAKSWIKDKETTLYIYNIRCLLQKSKELSDNQSISYETIYNNQNNTSSERSTMAYEDIKKKFSWIINLIENNKDSIKQQIETTHTTNNLYTNEVIRQNSTWNKKIYKLEAKWLIAKYKELYSFFISIWIDHDNSQDISSYLLRSGRCWRKLIEDIDSYQTHKPDGTPLMHRSWISRKNLKEQMELKINNFKDKYKEEYNHELSKEDLKKVEKIIINGMDQAKDIDINKLTYVVHIYMNWHASSSRYPYDLRLQKHNNLNELTAYGKIVHLYEIYISFEKKLDKEIASYHEENLLEDTKTIDLSFLQSLDNKKYFKERWSAINILNSANISIETIYELSNDIFSQEEINEINTYKDNLEQNWLIELNDANLTNLEKIILLEYIMKAVVLSNWKVVWSWTHLNKDLTIDEVSSYIPSLYWWININNYCKYRILMSALNKFTKYEWEVYRTEDAFYRKEDSKQYARQKLVKYYEWIENILRRWRPYKPNKFYSTSKENPTESIITSRKTSPHHIKYVITSKNGVDISNINSEQKEILFSADAKFSIQKAEVYTSEDWIRESEIDESIEGIEISEKGDSHRDIIIYMEEI